MPARSIDTATIAFGLVSIPIKIYSTSEPSHEIHFHLIHEGCGQRLRQKYACPQHGEVEREDMAKGYELSKGHFVELAPDELKALDAVASREVAIREFVPASAVDPIFVDRTYYLGPDRGGERAYRLLRDALADAELVGIASFAARGKQYVVMVRPFADGLAMHQLRYRDEVKDWSEIALAKLPAPTAAELALARQVIGQLESDSFDPAQYTDEVKGRVRALIADKAKGGEIVAPRDVPRVAITDLVAALKASLQDDQRDTKHSRRDTKVRATHAKRAGTGRGTRGHAATARASRGARTHHGARARGSHASAKRAGH